MQAESKTLITSYDVLKTLAVFLMIVDHVGLYLYPDIEMLRVIGRLSAPIWLFLIGFARSRDVPFSWIFWFMLDLGLSFAVGLPLKGNILLTLALVRLSMTFIEPLLYPRNRFTIAFAVFAIVMVPLTKPFFEYGSYAWLLAAIGLWVRRDGIAGIPWIMSVLFGYFVIESLSFHFGDPQMLVFAGGLMCIGILLIYFNPEARIQLSTRWTAGMYRFFGRHSLIFYALHLMALKILWYFLNRL